MYDAKAKFLESVPARAKDSFSLLKLSQMDCGWTGAAPSHHSSTEVGTMG